jgi:RNA polymerase sigma-70 factor (ECF subfamily)
MLVSDYNACVDKHADGLYRFILKHIKDIDKAKDVVQDSFEKLWLKASEVSAEKAKSYLFTTAYRTMLDYIRKDGKQSPLTDSHERSAGSSKNQYSDLNEILHQALDRLPEIQKTVVLLRDYEGYNYDEIGEITGLSESQVKVYIFRARTALKEYLISMDFVL